MASAEAIRCLAFGMGAASALVDRWDLRAGCSHRFADAAVEDKELVEPISVDRTRVRSHPARGWRAGWGSHRGSVE